MNRFINICLFFFFTGWMAFGNDISLYSGRNNEGNIKKEHRDETLVPPKVTQEGHSVIIETDKEENIDVEITTREGETVYTRQENATTALQVDLLPEGDYTIEITIGENSYAEDFSI